MDLDNSRIQALVDRPAESLSVEIKTWFNPESVEGQVKLVRTLLALRNHDGGYFVIGIDDKTLTPDTSDVPANVKELFHPDKLHALISRFASEPFEIVVEFVKRDRIDFPVIVVPSGTRTPVAAKSDLKLNDKRLVSTGDVYVRTLNANRIPSSARANWNDWASIVDVCFNNREADIGRFMRRHLTGSSAETLKEIFAGLSAEAGEQNRGEKDCSQLLDQGRQRFISDGCRKANRAARYRLLGSRHADQWCSYYPQSSRFSASAQREPPGTFRLAGIFGQQWLR